MDLPLIGGICCLEGRTVGAIFCPHPFLDHTQSRKTFSTAPLHSVDHPRIVWYHPASLAPRLKTVRDGCPDMTSTVENGFCLPDERVAFKTKNRITATLTLKVIIAF